MHPLVLALSKWKGRQALQKGMEALGLRVPRVYQDYVVTYFNRENPGSADDLPHYWDEWAKEYVCTAGRANPNLREFDFDSTYRSAYLDELAAKQSSRKQIYKDPPLHPCLHIVAEREDANQLGDYRPSTAMRAEKAVEAREIGFPSIEWRGLKKELIPLFQERMIEQGFIRKGRLFVRRSNSVGLVFRGWQDTGGMPDAIQLSLSFSVAHESDPGLAFVINSFDPLMPGFRSYALIKTAADAQLGIYAHTHAFRLFCEMLTDT